MSKLRTKKQLLELIENRVKEFTGWLWVNARVKNDCLIIKQQDLYSHSTIELEYDIKTQKEIVGSIKRIGLSKGLLKELKQVLYGVEEDANKKPTRNFVSASKLASSLAFAKVYLLSREKDYKEFCSQLTFYDQDDSLETQERYIVSELPNGKKVTFYRDGTVVLLDVYTPLKIDIKFESFEQFAAYYLATHG